MKVKFGWWPNSVFVSATNRLDFDKLTVEAVSENKVLWCWITEIINQNELSEFFGCKHYLTIFFKICMENLLLPYKDVLFN